METTAMQIRTCLECGEKLFGRTDQKYCGEMCRSAAHNRIKHEKLQQTPECIKRIQKALMKNYEVLVNLRNRGSQLFSKLYLMDLGFNFHHVTSFVEKDGTILCYCFNQGYTVSGEQVILLSETLA